ncbi:MAG: hypothetical protein F6K31_05035 [Symploca sp. SIO2G7]|nr:hypothetical protein [Symploca sp. SIO2G7]
MKNYTLALDEGNFDLKYLDGSNKPKAIRSVRFQLPNGRFPLSSSNTSPLIEFDGKRYHFGYQAYKYRRQSHTVEEEKEQVALLNALACIEQYEPEFTLTIHTSHPEPEKAADTMRKQLVRTVCYKRNSQLIKAHIKAVHISHEGYPAYQYAKSLGLVPDDGFTVVIDIGGGTWLSRLIDDDGEIIDSTVSKRGGAYDLATAIKFDDRLAKALGDKPDAGMIANGFADGSHHYPHNPDASWKIWLDEHLEPWFKGIFGEVRNQYQPYLPRVRKFLVTGGASHLIAHKVQAAPLFAVIPEPRFANVRGLMPVTKTKKNMVIAA